MSSDPTALPVVSTPSRAQARRLREIYRSAGWPCQDPLELELLAGGLIERRCDAQGRETLRLTASGIALVASQMAIHRAALSQHEALVQRVAQEMARAGRIAWCGLGLRAQTATEAPGQMEWRIARPDVFSIRNTSKAQYVEPIVHEIKVRRADLLSDLRRPAKRASYLHLGECWYVLGEDARGRAIGEPDEIPAECGVLMAQGLRLQVARPAIRRARSALPFDVWMSLAKAAPSYCAADEDAQALLGDGCGQDEGDAPPAD